MRGKKKIAFSIAWWDSKSRTYLCNGCYDDLKVHGHRGEQGFFLSRRREGGIEGGGGYSQRSSYTLAEARAIITRSKLKKKPGNFRGKQTQSNDKISVGDILERVNYDSASYKISVGDRVEVLSVIKNKIGYFKLKHLKSNKIIKGNIKLKLPSKVWIALKFKIGADVWARTNIGKIKRGDKGKIVDEDPLMGFQIEWANGSKSNVRKDLKVNDKLSLDEVTRRRLAQLPFDRLSHQINAE